ncbi:MAG: OmpA family protein [Cypionkella sp.]|uniref:OmpA family protein n=1 Tax=Cypionkella sp. TaxID=2811411 RepID=UPI0026115928|nr:OmpA family protein [Cypionkella sp.]MDB5660630.1 OmpA family protein [Cypionkella sp.]MDB5663538.1 OmpA family protein [Cypionkella sp.]
MNLRSLPLIAAAMFSLAACDPVDFNREAGASVGDGGFGSANTNNTLVMSGERDYTIALAQRFAQTVPTTITFAFNSAALSPEARATLAQQADFIRQFPQVRFRVYGHTDLVGSNAYNKALGLRRARAAVAYLASLGIGSSRLEAVVSFGKTRPIIQTTAPEQRNRRTVTEVSGFVKSNPMVLNGKYAAIIMQEYVKSAVPAHPNNEVIKTQVSGTE